MIIPTRRARQARRVLGYADYDVLEATVVLGECCSTDQKRRLKDIRKLIQDEIAVMDRMIKAADARNKEGIA